LRFDLLPISELKNSFSEAPSIGLGSGRTVAEFLRYAESAKLLNHEAVYIPSSSQIAAVADELGLTLGSDQQVGRLKLTVDGADQSLPNGIYIKGGGGALLREKILWSLSESVCVLVTPSKVSQELSVPIPLEVHPMAVNWVLESVRRMGGKGKLRLLEKGYHYTTENGNVIVDASFTGKELSLLERELKTLPGVLEVGIFNSPSAKLYVVME
jgi:ribose 5-phosphate isomerase A